MPAKSRSPALGHSGASLRAEAGREGHSRRCYPHVVPAHAFRVISRGRLSMRRPAPWHPALARDPQLLLSALPADARCVELAFAEPDPGAGVRVSNNIGPG